MVYIHLKHMLLHVTGTDYKLHVQVCIICSHMLQADAVLFTCLAFCSHSAPWYLVMHVTTAMCSMLPPCLVF